MVSYNNIIKIVLCVYLLIMRHSIAISVQLLAQSISQYFLKVYLYIYFLGWWIYTKTHTVIMIIIMSEHYKYFLYKKVFLFLR